MVFPRNVCGVFLVAKFQKMEVPMENSKKIITFPSEKKRSFRNWRARLRRELNKEQYFFVTHRGLSLMGIAGPGSGKTRALTYRVADLLQENVAPENILLVTFTNKAAGEMKNRVSEIMGFLPPGLWAGTFHSIGARTLRRHAPLVQRNANFSILDEEDREAMLRTSLTSLNLNLTVKEHDLFVKKKLLGKILSSARNSGQPLAAYLENQYPELLGYLPVLNKVEEAYEERKRRANAFDFDDLLCVWLQLLQTDENIRQRYQAQFQHILVDEYQDTNAIQNQLVLLLGEKGATCLVGDDAQSIYSFRCAEVENILNFSEKRPGCTIVKLTRNYRSVPEILALANQSIAYNKRQISKELTTVRESGETPHIFLARNNYEEADFIAGKIEDLCRAGHNLKDIAVLYRSSYLSQDVEMELINRGIPYLTFGGLKFLQRAHIKDILAWLKILGNSRDELAWRRLALMQKGIGESTFRVLWQEMGSHPEPLAATLEEKIRPRRGHKSWKTLAAALQQLDATDKNNVPLLIKIIMEGPYREYLQGKYPDDYKERSMSIERLAAYGARCSSLQEFLESLLLEETLIMDSIKEDHPGKDYLTLSTIHSAKGKEWGTVLLIGLNEGRFPSLLGRENMEEERRLFYVAVTRAKDLLYLTTSQEEYRGWGNFEGRPSTFLQELPPHCYQLTDF